MSDILSWPGKSALDTDTPAHPAVYHMLDVAAVAEHLIAPFGVEGPTRAALILLTALHDLGKINEDFRQMLDSGRYQGARHWEVSELLLQRHDDLLAPILGSTWQRRFMLYAATAGHHGRPPRLEERDVIRSMAKIGASASGDARTVIEEFVDLWPQASLHGATASEIQALSWWLPGLVSAADWIGSNTQWFPARPPGLDLPEYLAQARLSAKVAIEGAGVAGQAVSDAPLFDFTLRPMQQACADIPLPEGPMLAVIEDETGAGKTEAALILAQRMLRQGKGRGLYFALPTMATSDAMFDRAASIVGRMFAQRPTLTLAHGRAAQSGRFRDVVLGSRNAPGDVSCTEWLADDRRRSLLADVGVGTIDQALLAALPTRFHTLRHFALSSKILIVDEAHELGEPYIGEVLETLLRMHRQAGGSAILLTATLPLAQRRRLMAVYGEPGDNLAYPALTIAGGASRTDLPQETAPRGPVHVERLTDPQAAVALLARAAGQGAACVWVRNAVDDAIAAVEALRAAGVDADLLHARFALTDRKRIEARMLDRFGKDGQGRAGRVLVGTQVLESSLDLDFDVMVSDLAPMAGLIQRAGRLWRHMALRPRAVRPVPDPVLHVVAPDPTLVEDDRWLTRVLDRGAYVYPLADQWRTAAALFRVGRIVAPSGLRELVEAVHGEAAAPVPPVLERAELEAEGRNAAHGAHGRQNVIDLTRDFRAGSGQSDDASYPTRLGLPVRTLALAVASADGLTPWGGDWALAEVSAAEHRLKGLALPDQSDPRVSAVTASWPEWRRNTSTICPIGPDGAICEGLAYDAEMGLIFG